MIFPLSKSRFSSLALSLSIYSIFSLTSKNFKNIKKKKHVTLFPSSAPPSTP